MSKSVAFLIGAVIAVIAIIYVVLFRSTPKEVAEVAVVASGTPASSDLGRTESQQRSTPTEQEGGSQLNESIPAVVNRPVQEDTPTPIAANPVVLEELQRDEYGRFIPMGSPAEIVLQQEAISQWSFVAHPDVADWAQGLTYDEYHAGLDEATRVQIERQKLSRSELIYWNLRNWVGAPDVLQYH